MRPNLKEHRNHKIKSDYGIDNYYKYYKSKGGSLSKAKYREVLYTFNKGLYPIICTFNYEYKLPMRLGSIYVVQREPYIKLDEEGNLKTNKPVNHKATLDMWEKDPKTREDGLVVRFENTYVFNILYGKRWANYRNKTIYSLNITRELKHYLRDVIRNNPNFKAQKRWK